VSATRTYDVFLHSVDAENKIKVINEVRALTGLALREAKELVEGAPPTRVLRRGVSRSEARRIVERLNGAGAFAFSGDQEDRFQVTAWEVPSKGRRRRRLLALLERELGVSRERAREIVAGVDDPQSRGLLATGLTRERADQLAARLDAGGVGVWVRVDAATWERHDRERWEEFERRFGPVRIGDEAEIDATIRRIERAFHREFGPDSASLGDESQDVWGTPYFLHYGDGQLELWEYDPAFNGNDDLDGGRDKAGRYEFKIDVVLPLHEAPYRVKAAALGEPLYWVAHTLATEEI
jgi:Ribosomal protein L7/L12 C-terminal domain